MAAPCRRLRFNLILLIAACLRARASETVTYTNSQTSSATRTTATDQTLTLELSSSSDTATQSGVISGAGHVAKTGAGTIILTGANTYTGNTTVSAGTLQIGNGGASGSLASATLAIASGATASFDRSGTATFAGSFSGTGSLIKAGSGSLTLSGSGGSFEGQLTVSAGSLILTNTGNALGASATVTIASGATLSNTGGAEGFASLSGAGTMLLNDKNIGVTHTGTVTFSGVISDTGTAAVSKSGTGTWILSGANTYTGTTNVNAGTLQIGAGGATGSLASGSLVIDAGATARFDRTGTATFSGSLSGAGDFIKAGSGSLSLAGTGTGFTGRLIVSAGSLSLDYSGDALNAVTPVTVESGASLSIAGGNENFGSLAGAGTMLLASRALGVGTDNSSTTFSGAITDAGSGTVTKAGTGTWTLTGTNTYSGTTTISGGTLQLGSGGATGSVAGNIVNNAALIVNRGTTYTYTGIISGTGTLVKSGTGLFALSGTHTYTGATSINAGQLQLNGSAASSAFTVNSGGTLSGAATVGTLTVASGGTLAPGASPGTLRASATTLNGGSTFAWELNRATGGAAGTNWDLLSVTGALTLSATSGNRINVTLSTLDFTTGLAGAPANVTPGANYTFAFASATTAINGFSADQFSLNTTGVSGFGAGSWAVTQTGTDLNLTFTSAIPEPSTYAALVGVSALALAAWRRRRTRSHSS